MQIVAIGSDCAGLVCWALPTAATSVKPPNSYDLHVLASYTACSDGRDAQWPVWLMASDQR